MGWFARLLAKKPGFEAWWEVTGPTFSEQRMAEVVRSLTEQFQRHQANKGEQILFLLLLSSTALAERVLEDGVEREPSARDSDEQKLQMMMEEHRRALSDGKLRVFPPDYMGALAWMIAQQIHQLWQMGLQEEAVETYEGLIYSVASILEQRQTQEPEK